MRTFDRLTAVTTLLVIPLVVPFVGEAIIGSSETELRDWWTSPLGYALVGAVLAGFVAAFRPHRMPVVVAVATAAGCLTWLAPYAAFLIFILFGGDPGWR